MDLKKRLLNKEKLDPIDILETYTAKHAQREKNKEFFKSELWQRKLCYRRRWKQN